MVFEFDDFELDTDQVELRDNGRAVPLEPKSFDLLVFLIQNHDRVLSRDEIFDQIWPDVFVTDASLSTAIAQIRRALRDDGNAQRYIKTIRGRGFRFAAPVKQKASARPKTASAENGSSATQDRPVAGPPVIVVIPFDLIGTDDTHHAIAEALPTELITTLSQLKWVKVIARASAFQFRGRMFSIKEIRETLGAAYVLSGSVELSGTRLSIAAELVDARTEHIVWTDAFSGKIDDVFNLRTQIAREIANITEYRLALNESDRLNHVPSENLDAWGHYHRGVRAMFHYNQSDNEVAGDHFAKAAKLDPKFARAQAALSYTEFQNYFQQFGEKFSHHKALALEHAQTAVKLDPLDPYSNLMLGRAKWILGEVENGLIWVNKSLMLAPNYSFGYYNSALLNTVLCDGERAETHVASALVRSPIDPHIQTMLGTRALAAFVRDDADQALRYAEQAMQTHNAHVHVHLIAAGIYSNYGQEDKAIRALSEVKKRNIDMRTSGFSAHFELRHETRKHALFGALERLGA
ncbi:winged helix-turn-helix domain-containing protein [Ruegeria sp.]|uniref:winged helix-turn-helix domain-containing protein n=1 Tax=Ruegeria sp. TaxID=1879320 RepID=UPI003C7D2B68